MANVPFIREHAAEYADDMVGWFLGLLIETAGRITDFNVGSNARNIFETIGLRFEHLDNKVFLALRRAIPIVLYDFFGEGDGITTTVGFPLLPALPAQGIVRFTRATSSAGGEIVVPVGTRVMVPGTGTIPAKLYQTILPLTVPAGTDLGETLVRAGVTGSVGNTPANAITLLDSIADVGAATNPAAFINGAEAETDEGRRQRFVQYLRNLARCQLAGLEAGALTGQLTQAGAVVEHVLFARAVNVSEKRGLVTVYVDNGGATASPALVAATQAVIDGGFASDGSRIIGYKAAGVEVVVEAVVPQIVDVTAEVRVAAGFRFADVGPAVEAAVEAYLFGLGVFENLIYADLICTIAMVQGVADLAGLSPTANVVATSGGRIIPGTVTVTEVVP